MKLFGSVFAKLAARVSKLQGATGPKRVITEEMTKAGAKHLMRVLHCEESVARWAAVCCFLAMREKAE